MPSVIVVGGGLAGMAAAAALGDAGYQVDLYETKPFLGGRATSYPVPGGDGSVETIDNCQHVLLRCCRNLIDLYDRLGVRDAITFHREFYFIEPGGRTSVLRAGLLPRPFHFTEGFILLKCLNLKEKLAIGRALIAVQREYGHRRELESMSMLDWLREKRQPTRAVERFWRQILVSAINEELDQMAALYGCQVFLQGFLARSNSYEMGIPRVPLGELYATDVWRKWSNVRLHLRSRAERVSSDGVFVDGELQRADYVIVTVPFERLEDIMAEVNAPAMTHSPITGIHLWFDRPVTDLPHATLLDRTIQWMFNKADGRQVQLVVSASRSLIPLSKTDIVSLALRELTEFLPAVSSATLIKSHVVKEVRATFSGQPGVESLRPHARTTVPNVFLAGDYTSSGWPATMEGAVRSGYIAAEAVTQAQGAGGKFLLSDPS